MRHILETAVRSETRLRLGSALADSSCRLGLTNQVIDALDLTRAHETGRKPVDEALLRLLTASMPLRTQTAADLVRSMRDGDRI